MDLDLQPLRDLVDIGPAVRGLRGWESTGEDPCFRVSFGIVRRRFIVIRLESLGPILNPTLYLDYGAGFSERHTLVSEPGRNLILVVDVGTVGTVRAIRFDPCASPARFNCAAESFKSRNAADRRVSALLSDREATSVQRFGRLGRLWLRNWKMLPSIRSNSIRHTVERVYALAASEHSCGPDDGRVWLSLVVPVYDTPVEFLQDLLSSFQSQAMRGIELVLSDDGSPSAETRAWLGARQRMPGVKIVLNEENQGIALCTNAGLAVCSGAWIGLLDHDDLVAPSALSVIWQAISRHPDSQFIYTDELVVDRQLKPIGYMLKPAYDPILLSGVNYINHLSLYRRARLEQIGGFRPGFEGSQDYDLLLRYLKDVPQEAVLHIPYPAYWWRRTGETYSRRHLDRATSNARHALADRFLEAGSGRVEAATSPHLHKVSFEPSVGALPKISVIIPSKNAPGLIATILSGLFEKTDYPDFEVLVIDNGTTDEAVLELYSCYSQRHRNFSAHINAEAFNFSRSVNRGLSLASGDHYLLLNNDVEVIHTGWLREMVSCLRFEGVGIVGAKLLYPDDTLQHAGVVAGFGGLAGHWYLGKPKDFGGPLNRLHVRSSMSCVTGAVMLISAECRKAVGTFDEQNFAVAYNDVDYCLRAYAKGIRAAWTPFATLYHHESVSRGSEKSQGNRTRFEFEKENLRRLHGTSHFIDPAASPMNSRTHSTPRLDTVSELPRPRTWFKPNRA